MAKIARKEQLCKGSHKEKNLASAFRYGDFDVKCREILAQAIAFQKK